MSKKQERRTRKRAKTKMNSIWDKDEDDVRSVVRVKKVLGLRPNLDVTR